MERLDRLIQMEDSCWRENSSTPVALLDQIRQHVHVRLRRVAPQHQRHRVVLAGKHLAELLPEAGRFLGGPVRPHPQQVSRTPPFGMGLPSPPAPAAAAERRSVRQRAL
ncbi:hypothetical protein EYF80_036398 [Liparis tanakae]|uniref:Uncharacterized protein n=1 Tax=Liparis tanakae TaxID=230148 RepID=A0A4Z2GJN4_9TELE|nr:hypothetical protein EYF80_036398 [Liparis tanakae]